METTALSNNVPRAGARWRALACALGLAAASAAFGAPRGIGIEDPAALDVDPRSHAMLEIVQRLGDPKGVRALALAPDGAHAAMIGWTGLVWRLLLMDTATLKTREIPAYENLGPGSDRFQPLAVHWIDAGHMIVDWSDNVSVVMDLDGQRGRKVGTRVMGLMRKPDGSFDDWVIVSENGLFDSRSIHRVNVRTGQESNVPIGLSGDVVQVRFDPAGHLRAALTRDSKWFEPGAKLSTWYRHDEQSPWQLLQQRPASEYGEMWHLAGVRLDADRLLVMSREGRDTWAMFDYDVAAGKLGAFVISHDTEDLASVNTSQNEPVRVVTQGLKRTTHWFDPEWDRIQRAVDAALPATTNELSGDPKHVVLVFSHSDRDPGVWRMLDTTRMKMRPLAKARLSIDPALMRPMQAFTYDATDGLKVPAYLTLPAGPEVPRPMVVLIHGGPTARDRWGFDFDAQALAAAGYAVFQPQFRGSAGFGKAFEVAGYRQWGLAMQDDVTAGVKAMIARGVADPRRICAYGASYGGYAAMWGLVKTPELYQCGITLAGVSDIGEMFTDWSDTNDDDTAKEIVRFRVGDIATMKSQFDEVSPAKHADRIRVPVLIAHGEADRRVPIGHAKRLNAALQDAHKPVQTQWYSREGHGFRFYDDQEHFAMLAVRFLDRNIGPASPLADRWVPVPAASAASASIAASSP